MATKQIEPERVRTHRHRDDIEEGRGEGDTVVYWMQAAQRAEGNDALEHAIQRANELGLPLCVVFGWVADFPEANARHHRFMLEGLAEVEQALRRRSIAFTVSGPTLRRLTSIARSSSGSERFTGRAVRSGWTT